MLYSNIYLRNLDFILWNKTKKNIDNVPIEDPPYQYKIVKMRNIIYNNLNSSLLLNGINGILVSFICTPFDVIKNYWIYNIGLEKYDKMSTLLVAKKLYKYRGIRTFWSGFLHSTSYTVPSNIIFYSSYNYFLTNLGLSAAISGMQARILTIFTVAPMEFIKTRVQAKAGTINTKYLIKNLINNGEITHLWLGTWTTILRDVPFTATYWTFVENLRKKFIINNNQKENKYNKLFLIKLISIGSFSGVISTLISHPLDVIKTNIQVYDLNRNNQINSFPLFYHNLFNKISSEIFKKQGIKGFYVGIVPRIAKVMPACAISLTIFELSRQKKLKQQDNK
ncbi:carrier protein [Cryptosporidium andersoni]|uniref:Carrier protein n=1 Tax=Cryptosporidium andersoni TaxID=117008 RepID=A0A1J4MU22_9CRYT|nr:carrier protein [Cryptosporidium andersoni]